MNFKSIARPIFYISFCLLALSLNCFSQQTNKYNLLWEISGNGLKKPSYLFGSMHIKDRRVFNFSDSVMKAIEASSAFALEVHPDTMLKTLFEKKLEGKEVSKSFLKNDYTKEDDMQTFIDAYLYGIARTYKKKIFGLEKAETQMGLLYGDYADDLFNVDSETELREMEKMIDVYTRGNINEIITYFKGVKVDLFDLIGRNQVMTKSITDLLKSETLFATVGVAHLPGEDGIIALLQRSGYKMRAVEATFTGVSAKHKIDYDKMDWYTYQSNDGLFSVDFPSPPFLKQREGEKYAVFPDMISNVLFTASSTYIGPGSFKSDEVYLDALVDNFLKDSVELLSRKKIVKYGAAASEVLIKKNGQFARVLMLLKNNSVYYLSLDNKRNNLNEAFADRYFNSVKINNDLPKEQWVDFKNVEGAFVLKMPYQPDPMHTEVANPKPDYPAYFLNMYGAVDKLNMVNYLVRYSDFPAGLYLADKAEVFEASIKDFEKKGELLGEPKVIFNNGFEGRSLKLIIKGMLMEIQVFLRGNRTYLLLRQNMKGTDAPKDDLFFDSFKFEKYAFNKGVTSTIGSITMELPQKPIMQPQEKGEDEGISFLKNNKSYSAVNANSGGLYSIEQADVSKYYRTRNLDSLYNLFLEELRGVGDSIYSSENIIMAGVNTKQNRSYNKLSGNHKLSRILIHNNKFYCWTIIGDKEEFENLQYDNMFKNIHYGVASKTFDLASSKARLILQDVKSTDTLIQKEAAGAVGYYEFTKDELPLIYSALKYKYKDDTVRTGIRNLLIQDLLKLQDKNAIRLLKDLYNDVNNAERVRVNALSKVAEIDKNSYDWYLNTLLESKPFNSDLHWGLFKPLNDSLSFAGRHIDKLVKIMEHKSYRPSLLNTMTNMSTDDNKEEYLKVLKGFKGEIMKHTISDLEGELLKLDKSGEFDSGFIYSYLKLMPELNMSDLTDQFTKKLFAADSINFLHTSALVARITAGLDLDKDFLNSQLDSLDTRYQIMEAFYGIGELDKVPFAYRKHDEFAKLLLYNYLYEESDSPDSIGLLGKIQEEAEVYYAIEFAYKNDEGVEQRFIGVVGAFDDQDDKLNFKKYRCHSNFDEVAGDWTSQAKLLIKELKKSE